jgi:hypothetical protein
MRGNVQSFLNSIPDPSKMTPEEQLNLGLNANPIMGLLGMTAYHGSPHIFNKFDINKVGTGEGAQAYGHGMYFAENPKIAEGYSKDLGTEIIVGNKPIFRANKVIGTTGNEAVDDYLLMHHGDINNALKSIKNDYNIVNKTNPKGAEAYLPNIKALEDLQAKNAVKVNSTGNIYKVDIPDENIPKLLNWDAPIKDQPEMYNLIKNNIKDADIRKSFENNAESGITGANAYSNYLSGKTNAEKSKNALNIGIKGIKYLDQGSRQAGGTNNFVVFDPSQVKILERNNKGLLK